MEPHTNEKPGQKNNVFNNYYACLVPFGHAENGFMILSLMPVKAQTPNDAKIAVREKLPHVKDDKSYAVMGIMEITDIEYELLDRINDFDPYLFSELPPNDPSVVERRILIPEREAMISNDPQMMRDIIEGTSRHKIKFAEDFAPWLVLQRYYAPYINNGKLIHDKINMFAWTKDYLTATIKHIIIEDNYPIRNMKEGKHGTERDLANGRSEVLLCYCKLFGKNNPLGIVYNPNAHTLRFPTEQDKENFTSISIPQPNDYEEKIWKSRCPALYADKPKKAYQIPKDMTPAEFDKYAEEHKSSQIDKFNARLAKTQAMQGKTK